MRRDRMFFGGSAAVCMIAAAFLTLACTRTATAQIQKPQLDPDASGTLFYVAFPDTTGNNMDKRFWCVRGASGLQLWIFSDTYNRVTITSGTGITAALTVDPGRFKIFDIPTAMIITQPNVRTNQTFRVEAEHPIVMYSYLATEQGLEAWTPIPVAAWGTDYYAASIPGETVEDIGIAGEREIPSTKRGAPAEILIIAAYNNTHVTITPPVGIGLAGSIPVLIPLNAGDAYLVQSRIDTMLEEQDDIAGTRIQSDMPIGVLSGNSRARAQREDAGLKDNVEKNMLMEWLPPTEMHGTEFAYLPTWDGHRAGLGALLERRREYTRVYNTQRMQTAGYQLAQGGTTKLPFTLPTDTWKQFSLGVPVGTYFKTDQPSQAMMHSSAIVALVGSTPCYQGLPCLSYQAVAPYMVELTPREQWTTFAPYYAPAQPGGMNHYINVVTDTAHAKDVLRDDGASFPMTRPIPGTDLIWGSMPVNAGTEHFLIGRNGAHFGGFVYGILEGKEDYRPGVARKRDPNPSSLGGGGRAPQPMHPAEFEECAALSYGYPLTPKRRVLRQADTLLINTKLLCGELRVNIRAINANPVGLRSLVLDPAGDNVRLVPVVPDRLSDIPGRSAVEVMVIPIDPLHSAHGTLIVTDRTSHTWRVPFTYVPDSVEITPANGLDFGMVTINTAEARTVTIRNPLDHPVEMQELRLAIGAPASPFTITSVTPSGPEQRPAQPVTLAPGASMQVVVSVTPPLADQVYLDSIRVKLGCLRIGIPLRAETAVPIVYVDNLNFGSFDLPAPDTTLPLDICNIGRGTLTFRNDTDAAKLLAWGDPSFSVPATEIQALASAKLGPNQCFTVHVTFHPATPGLFRTTARFYSSTRVRRDTSIWRAVVTRPGAQLTGYDWHERWVVPGNCTKDRTPGYDTVIWFYNTGTSPARVRSIELLGKDADAGYFVLDTTNPATTIRPGREALPGDTVHNRLFQRVIFRPLEERPYEALVRVITEHGDTVVATLAGTGIESHGQITGAHFGALVWRGAYPATTAAPLSVELRALPTRPLRVDGVKLIADDVNDFTIDLTGVSFPFTMQPGETRRFAVEFHPLAPGPRRAVIAFMGDQMICKDSTNVLDGSSASNSAVTQGVTLPQILLCDTTSGFVEVRNTGADTITVTDAVLVDSSGTFTFPEGNGGATGRIAPNESRRVRVLFTPRKSGAVHAYVRFEAYGADGGVVPLADAELNASAGIITVRASAPTDRHGLPGSTVNVPITLEGPLDDARITSLVLSLNYNQSVVRLMWDSTAASLFDGTLLAGWKMMVMEDDVKEGELMVVLTAPDGEYLHDRGLLMNPRFQLHLADVDFSTIRFYLLPVGRECARVMPKPGRVQVDPICGLNLRLIESSGIQYALRPNRPNPFNPSTDITFSLGLDGQTRLVVYDEAGHRVATLVDEFMRPGTYQVTWDASSFPSGLYYYRLESGTWARTATMMLRK